jgi:hypothetical protein
VACSQFYNFRNNYKNVNSLIHDTKNLKTKPFLKAHLINGNVCIYSDTWKIDTIQNRVTGKGKIFDYTRYFYYEGNISTPIDSVAIFETNRKIENPESGRITALVIFAAVDIVIGIVCISNPKACFGSCPTFYINENDNFHYADAEGFSSSIAPWMECYDIDALNNKKISGDYFSITMKNEALETHCVKEVKLLAYPRKNGERIYHSPKDEFFLCENIYPIKNAKANEGDVTNLFLYDDRKERFSLADDNNLNTKEEIYLTFDHINLTKDLGLIINFRQTLMSTYFLYSALGYMGDEVTDFLAKTREDYFYKDKLENGIQKLLGNIDVYFWNEQTYNWEFQGGFFETGPIAINRQILPLHNYSNGSKIKIKLRINKGLWRIDYIALTNIKSKVKPFEIAPKLILNKGKIDSSALIAMNNPKKYLISMPGSLYKFIFMLPNPNEDYELFLYSKGYYLEWIRENWLKDKDLVKLKCMFDEPEIYLKNEAKNYKRYETSMEIDFWNSKINTNSFSYYGN